MDAKFIEIVENLVKEQGADTLIDAKKYKAYLADHANDEFKEERRLLTIAIEVGAGQEIANASDLAACKKQQIRLLREDRFIDETAAAETIDLLAFALRGDRSKLIASTPSSQPQSALRKIVLFSIVGVLALIGIAVWLWVVDIQAINKILDRAEIASNSENYQEVVSLYSQAIKLDPKYALAYYNRGVAYYYLGEYNKAIADYTQAIEFDPKYAPAYHNRGVAYDNLNDHNKAIGDFNQAIKLDPKDAYAYYNRGFAYAKLNDYSKAIDDFNQVIELKPNDAEAYNNRGFAYANLSDYNKAIADFTQAIKLDPNHAMAYANRGVAYADLSDYNKAIADFTQAIKLDPKDAYAYVNRGFAYAKLNDYKSATKDARKACELGDCQSLQRLTQRGLLRD
ncbi:MAG: tetratricopeptide repeat protein [Helicobacteraceae bacterium]|jgi:tetratricopeptide (TPR) repeat protein|nr:tetratricopeptide repeat protein [Helicobacteraceae bacterium]